MMMFLAELVAGMLPSISTAGLVASLRSRWFFCANWLRRYSTMDNWPRAVIVLPLAIISMSIYVLDLF